MLQRVVGAATPRLCSGYIKTSTRKDRMFGVTINNLWLKCYLKFYKIVAEGMRSSKLLARAIRNKYLFLIKKLNEKVYSLLETLITNSSSSAKIVHKTVSFSDSFNALTTSVGIVVLKDLECDVCKLAVDSTSNNFIPPFMLFFINIFDNILYIIYPHSDSSSVNIYHTFIYYKVDN